MKIYDFDDYRQYISEKLKFLPSRGRGELRKIAQSMGVHTTTVSQIFKGKKSLTMDQAMRFSEHWSLSELETEYLFALVQEERAGSVTLRKHFKNQRKIIKKRAADRKEQLSEVKELDGKARAQFYAHWAFSAARILSSIPKYQSVDSISDYLGLAPKQVAEILEFLVAQGLCVAKNGRITMGPTHTHVEAESVFAKSHYLNWRGKSSENYNSRTSRDFVFTSPVSISRKDFERIHQILSETLNQVTEIVENTEPEMLCCLNLDCIEIKAAKTRPSE